MNTRPVILIAISVLLICIIMTGVSAQEMKTGANVSQAYPNLGVDMQYYEIKYDPNNKDYINYYQVIRERIMQKLKALYRYHYRKGDIHLLFTLNSAGKLEDFYVDRVKSAQDDTLVDIATTSLKKSSPFPPFPKGLDQPRVSFNVVISFRDK